MVSGKNRRGILQLGGDRSPWEKNYRGCGFQNRGETRPGRKGMNGGGTQVGSDAENFPGNGQRLSCKGDNCCELLMGGPASGGVRNLNRSQGTSDFATCGRESAHRWEEGLDTQLGTRHFVWICATEVRVGHLAEPGARLPPCSSVIPSKTAGRSSPGPGAEGPGAALLLAWVLPPVSRGGLLEGTAGWAQNQGTCWPPPVHPKHTCI